MVWRIRIRPLHIPDNDFLIENLPVYFGIVTLHSALFLKRFHLFQIPIGRVQRRAGTDQLVKPRRYLADRRQDPESRNCKCGELWNKDCRIAP